MECASVVQVFQSNDGSWHMTYFWTPGPHRQTGSAQDGAPQFFRAAGDPPKFPRQTEADLELAHINFIGTKSLIT
jgi:hypothetical protein